MHIIGKVIEFDGSTGIVSTPDFKYRYLFLKKDLTTEVSVGDFVTFRGELVHDTLRAYFVKRCEYKNDIDIKMKIKKK